MYKVELLKARFKKYFTNMPAKKKPAKRAAPKKAAKKPAKKKRA